MYNIINEKPSSNQSVVLNKTLNIFNSPHSHAMQLEGKNPSTVFSIAFDKEKHPLQRIRFDTFNIEIKISASVSV